MGQRVQLVEHLHRAIRYASDDDVSPLCLRGRWPHVAPQTAESRDDAGGGPPS